MNKRLTSTIKRATFNTLTSTVEATGQKGPAKTTRKRPGKRLPYNAEWRKANMKSH